jgi:hypothetical protein
MKFLGRSHFDAFRIWASESVVPSVRSEISVPPNSGNPPVASLAPKFGPPIRGEEKRAGSAGGRRVRARVVGRKGG